MHFLRHTRAPYQQMFQIRVKLWIPTTLAPHVKYKCRIIRAAAFRSEFHLKNGLCRAYTTTFSHAQFKRNGAEACRQGRSRIMRSFYALHVKNTRK